MGRPLLNVTSSLQAQLIVFLAALSAALIFSLGLTRAVRDIATRLGVLDPCNDRSLHTEPLPRLGGVAIILAFALALTVVIAVFPDELYHLGRPQYALFGGALAIHLLGLLDDLKPMRARYKLAGQIAIAGCVYWAGLRIGAILLPGETVIVLPEAVALFCTVIWLVGITNAVNLIDGLDGLAAGSSLIAIGALFAVSITFERPVAALLCCVLAGTTLGFLRFNSHPATIFLGDSGSLFLGFMLAGLGIMGAEKEAGSISLLVPLLAFGLPVIDTGVAIFRRHLRRHPIFLADRGHIHHRLLSLGQTPQRVAWILYGASAILGTAAVILANYGAHVLFPLFIGFAVLAIFLQWLRFDEFQELGLLVRRGIRTRYVIGRNVRLREASARVCKLDNMRDILEVLQDTFSKDGVKRAEIRLQRSFLNGKVTLASVPVPRNDEIPIWAWSAREGVEPTWWRVALPLLGPDDRRFGSFVLWEDGLSHRDSISYIQVISEHLKEELQRKLHAFEWAIAKAVNSEAIALDVDGLAINAEGIVVADRVLHIDHTAVHRAETDPEYQTPIPGRLRQERQKV
jgi:UDP-GlcNAc:undecaprenyl-phosphate/decaprenyl-phosphate GlcNAc-1-phosphate transferase